MSQAPVFEGLRLIVSNRKMGKIKAGLSSTKGQWTDVYIYKIHIVIYDVLSHLRNESKNLRQCRGQ